MPDDNIKGSAPLDAQSKGTDTGTISTATLLTFLPKAFLLLNGVLAGAGYLFITGYLSKLGIHTSELEIGLPTLLLYGYFFMIESVWGSGLFIGMLATGAIVYVVIKLADKMFDTAFPSVPLLKRTFYGVLLGYFTFLAVFLVPGLIQQKGSANAVRDELTKMSAPYSDEHSRTHVFQTPSGTIEGSLIIADQKYTYLRLEDRVVKIANDTHMISREVRFSFPEGKQSAPSDGVKPESSD